MPNEKVSQLPTVANAQLTDVIYAVQSGVSVQETLQQVYTLFQTNTVKSIFAAYENAVASGVTGNGADYTIICPATRINIGTNYNTVTGLYTAPVTGSYLVGMSVTMDGFVVGNTGVQLTIAQAGSLNMNWTVFDIGSIGTIYDTTLTTFSGSQIVYLTATDTVSFIVSVDGNATPNVNVIPNTYVYGHFVG